ncbi:MAG TPA: hypothetical protein VHN14_21280 [Kofleriaceae bacterium]|nr:hypothetical protein [Kofleriaceae bacterium]
MREALLLRPTATQQILHRALGDNFNLEDLLADVARHYLGCALAQGAWRRFAEAE